jgi:hypothetical protein
MLTQVDEQREGRWIEPAAIGLSRRHFAGHGLRVMGQFRF